MDTLASAEYRSLRDTIRERGTARVWIFVVGLVAWAALAMATASLASLPVAMLGPLLVLGGVFEVVNALHVGAERIGRYLQVFHEPSAGWEHTAMAFGQAYPGSGPDPLFALFFAGAAVLNFIPVLLAEPVVIEVVVIGTAHLLFIVRLIVARRGAAHQRSADLERFEKLKAAMAATASSAAAPPSSRNTAN